MFYFTLEKRIETKALFGDFRADGFCLPRNIRLMPNHSLQVDSYIQVHERLDKCAGIEFLSLARQCSAPRSSPRTVTDLWKEYRS